MIIESEVLESVFPGVADKIDSPVHGVAIDSRMVKEGEIFFAIIGGNNDGHVYIKQAISNGAIAVVVQHGYDAATSVPVIIVEDTTKALGNLAKQFWARHKVPCVLVTGSCGKTTCTSMLNGIFSKDRKVLTPIKNYNNEYGLPLTILSLMEEHNFAVFEVASRNPGDLEYLVDICTPDVALVTNVAPVHIERFIDLDGIAKEKATVYRALESKGIAIVNSDDVYAPYFLSNIKKQRVISFGIDCPADVTCGKIKIFKNRLEFVALTPIGEILVNVPCIGVHNIVNILAVIAVAIAADVSMASIVSGLSTFKSKPQRLNVINGVNNSTVIDDTYNANPLSMQASLSTLDAMPGVKKVFVMGDMAELGEHSKSMHMLIGSQAKSLGVSMFLGYGNDTRYACEAFGSSGHHFNDKMELTKVLYKILDKTTVVLVKGSRSMKMEDIIKKISLSEMTETQGN